SRPQSVFPTQSARLIHLTNRTVSATTPSVIPSTDLHSVSSTPLCHPSTGLHSVSSTPLCHPSTGLHSVSSTPLCHSLHWPPLSVLHPPLSFPPLASTQCPPPPSVI
ncbi:unnamed protein product, partial [Staurois parvus]